MTFADTVPVRPSRRRQAAVLVVLCLAAQLLAIAVAPPAYAVGEVCYAVADGGDLVKTLELGSGGWAETANPGLPAGIDDVEAIAYWPGGSGTLYGSDANQLGTINPATGGFTALASTYGTGGGSLGNRAFDDVDSLTFDPFSGFLWGTNREPGALDLLLQIDPATGAHVPDVFGSGIDYVTIPAVVTDLNDVDDAAISSYDGTFFGIQNNSGTIDRLITIDRTTGATTDFGSLGPGTDPALPDLNDMEGLGFHNDGRLFGTTGNGAVDVDDDDRLWSINTTTALATDEFDLPSGFDHESFDCLTEPLNTITGTVWNDLDDDGVIDPGETGTDGVTVRLYRDGVSGDPADDGVLDPSDILVGTRETAGGGTYSFEIASTGAFVLDIDTADLPAGHSLTTDNLEVADFGTSFGVTIPDNDFGHRLPVPDLTITKTKSGGGSFAVGDDDAYDLLVENVGDASTTGTMTVTDTLPTGLTFVAAGSGGDGFSCSAVGQDVTCTRPAGSPLAVGATASIVLNVAVDAAAVPSVSNTAVVSTPGDDDPTNDDSTVVTPAGFVADVTVVKSAPSSVEAGASFDYSIVVSNLGPSDAADVTLSDPLPTGVVFDSVTPSPDCGESPVGTVSCSFGTIAADDSVVVTVSVFAPDVPGDVTNTATVATSTTESDDTNNSDDATTTVTALADVTVVKSAPSSVEAGASFDYSIVVSNLGPSDAADVTLSDPLPTGVVFDSVTPSPDCGESPVGTVSCSFGTIAADDSVVVTVSVFAPDVPGDVTNTATVATSTTESDDTNNSDDATTTVTGVGIGDFVWDDTNGDGIQDGGEPGIENVTVNLLDGPGGTVLETTTTDADGAYAFTNLALGDYVVSFETPSGYAPSPSDVGGDDTVDSDADETTGESGVVTVVSGTDDDTVDAGFYVPGRIADFVWDDTNGDGIQDGGEPGIENVAVNLLDGPGGSVLATTTTDVDGLYEFTGLAPGDYVVEFVAPLGFAFSPVDVGGDDTVDSDADLTSGESGVVTVVSGTDDDTVDAGLFVPGRIADFVWDDTNGDGIQDPGEPGIENVTVNLLDGPGGSVLATTTTDVDGLYEFTGRAPGDYVVSFETPAGFAPSPSDVGGDDTVDSDADETTGETGVVTVVSGTDDDTIDAGFFVPGVIGDFVWNDLDGDGIQDGGEPGIENVTVNLLDGPGGSVLATTTTDADGLYEFTGLAPGDYVVEFVAPGGFAPSAADVGGDDTVDSDADPTSGESGVVTVVSGTDDGTVDAGFFRSALGDFVWNDTNGDGIQDSGEPGIENVTVNLLDGPGGSVLATTTTDGDGLYAFSDLAPGDYVVSFETPAGFAASPVDVGGDDTVDSDADEITGESPTIGLGAGEVDDTVDAGFYVPGRIADFVWDDTNGDGIQDGGEPGIENVTVNLLDGPGGSVLATTTTDADGLYEFTGLAPGDYVVEFVAPLGFAFSPSDVGGDDTVDSDADLTSGESGVVTVVSGTDDDTVDAGLFVPGRIADFVWDDTNGDGIQDGGEPGIENVTVNLLDGPGGSVLATTTTDVDGLYEFTGLAPGDYVVEFVAPLGFAFSPVDVGGDDTVDSDADLTSGESGVVTVVSGTDDDTVDAGLFVPGRIADFVWDDTNGDGIQDPGEPGIENVTVNLLDGPGGSVLATTTTDVDGLYEFTGRAPGDYVVSFETPAGFAPSPSDVGGDDTVDSDADETTGETGVVTVVSGTDDDTIDAGFYEPPRVGDFVWDDLNGDGIQDPGEPGIENVTVNLLDGPGGTVQATTTTNASGGYGFAGLEPGTYVVEFEAPSGFVPSPVDAGDDALDSDADSVSGEAPAVTLTSGTDDDTIDAGFYVPGRIADFVWDDTNGDGIQDGGEPGIENVTVNLLDGPGGSVLATTTTDVDGLYEFTGLAPGDYVVEFVAPLGFAFSPVDVGGDDTVDSDADLTSGESGVVTVVSGTDDDTVDAGLFVPGRIGDFVWDDTNGDGIQDPGEPGIENVTVNLLDGPGGSVLATTTTDADGLYEFTGRAPGDYVVQVEFPTGLVATLQDQTADDADSDIDAITGESPVLTVVSGTDDLTVDAGLVVPAVLGDFVWDDTNGDGIQDSGEPGIENVTVNLLDGPGGSVLATTTTDSAGAYEFTGLAPGDYVVDFVTPSGFVPTPADQGGDDTVDSDADETTGESATVTLLSASTDDTVDAGFYVPGVLGDFVWDDTNGDGIQDPGEPGIENVTVSLLDGPGGSVLATTTTGSAGAYEFTGLAPGDYVVQVEIPSGSVASPIDATTDDADSDIDPTTGESPVVTVVSGTDDDTIDAGLIVPASIGDFVWDDLDGDGSQDPGEPGIEGVTVDLLDGPGGTVLATTTTDADGLYEFTGLAPGDYVVRVDVPGGLAATFPDNTTDDLDSDIDPTTGESPVITVGSNTVIDDVDAGLVTPVSLGDLVWYDFDGDGTDDAGEPGIEGVTITATHPGPDGIDGNGDDLSATTVTGPGGAYLLEGLVPGPWTVTATTPTGSTATVGAGGIATTLAGGQSDLDVDFGFVGTGSIGDLVWEDLDGDGSPAGETGIPGATVQLTHPGPDGTLGTGDDLTRTTVTDGDGLYAFSDLPPASYEITVLDPNLPGSVLTGGTDPLVVGLAADEDFETADFGYQRQADLVVTKVATESTVAAGEQVEWTITVANDGPAVSVAPVTLTDTLPAGIENVDATTVSGGWVCTVGAATIDCSTPDDLAVGANTEIVVTADVVGDAPSFIVNEATVAAGETFDPDPSNDTDDSGVSTTPVVDLAITKSHAGDLFVGQTGQYTLAVVNNGPSTEPGPITITDPLPAGLTFDGFAGADWNCGAVGQDVTCTYTGAPLAATDGTVVTLDVLPEVGSEGEVVNEATVSGTVTDADPTNDTDDDPSTIRPVSDLSITKVVVGPDVVPIGETVTYRVTVTNGGPSAVVGGLTVSDTIPAGLTFDDVVDPGPFGVTFVDPELTATLATLVSGASASFDFSVVVDDPDTIDNTASVVIDDPSYLDSNPDNNTSTDAATGTPHADLAITKSSVGDFTVGSPGTYTLDVANNGLSDVTGATTVTDALPAGLTFVSGTGTDWSCGAVGQDVTCTLGAPLAAFSSAPPITLTVDIGPAAHPQVVNEATVSSDLDDLDPSNDTDDAVDPVAPLSDLAITKSHTGDFLTGVAGTFDLVVTNNGPIDHPGGIVVSDSLPAGLSPVSATGSGVTCTIVGQDVTCERAAGLVVGAQFSIALEVEVGPAALGTVVNTATVSSFVADDDPSNDSDDDEVVVEPATDLAIVKTLDGDLEGGELGTYLLTVTNNGPVDSPGPISVSDDLPDGLTFDSVSADGWTCLASDSTVGCSRAAGLTNGESSVITLSVLVDAGVDPSVTNVASVDGPLPDPDPTNDTDSVTSPAEGLSDLVIEKTLVGDLVNGEEATFLVEVTNDGPVEAQGPLMVVDELPAGLDFVSAAGDGWTCVDSGQTVTCTHDGPLAVGDTISFELVALVTAAPGTEIENVVDVTGPNVREQTLVNNTDSTGLSTVAGPDTPPAPEGDLPRTGSDPFRLTNWALMSLVAGALFLALAAWRRRRWLGPG